MSALSPSITPSGGLAIDPTKQAEYPILLGEKLAGKQSAQGSSFINIIYNHKNKSATPRQQAKITRSSTSRDIYNLTLKDKAGNAEQTTLAYSYRGSLDPASPVSESDTRSLVLVFDPQRKAFILESISTHLNFNLRSAPGKSDKQVKQYPQLSTLLEDDQPSGDDRLQGSASEDEGLGPADSSNPYDYRHFLPKANDKLPLSTSSTPDRDPPNVRSKINNPPVPAKSQPKPRPLPKARPPTDSARQRKRVTGPSTSAKPPPAAKPAPKPAPRVEDVPAESSHSEGEEDLGVTSDRLAPSNIIIEGDLIIDMGSPPPSRPTFKVNPAHFSSNNVSGNESDAPGDEIDDIDDIDDLRLPSPAGHTGVSSDARIGHAPPEEEDDDGDNDSLAAEIMAKEMEAAFEESEREQTQFQPQQHSYSVQSEEESEVSEEE